MKTTCMIPLALASMLVMNACGKKEEEKAEEAQAESTSEAIQQFAEKAEEMGNRENVDPVDFHSLEQLLPGKLDGFERTEATGEKSGAFGFTISTAEGKYQGDADSNVDIQIIDTGGIAGVTTMTLAAWSMADINKETATGYEKTTKIDGYKAFEKYDNQTKSGELNILVGDRYVVNVQANNVPSDVMRGALRKIDLSKLEALK